MHRSRFPLALCVISALMFMVGCQSSGSGMASSSPAKAVLSTGQGGTTVVYLSTAGGGVERLASADVPNCPQCEADAKKYFETGVLVPKCSVCGATHIPLIDYSNLGHQ